jgi:bifunctional polynucleotide phosphatase/kinase
MDKCDYKPNPTLFTMLIGNNKINKDKSFFVGDALGRKSDYSDSDKRFAENIGISCYCPEQIFHTVMEPFEIPTIQLPDNEKQIIIMVGYPGSGKSTIANNICNSNPNFICIDGDTHKTSSKMIKTALSHVSQQKSIIFDATNSSSKKRQEYVEFGKKYNYKITCIHVSVPLEIAYKRNKLRNYEKYVPIIAYSVYSKNYQCPNENEGFTLITVQA